MAPQDTLVTILDLFNSLLVAGETTGFDSGLSASVANAELPRNRRAEEDRVLGLA